MKKLVIATTNSGKFSEIMEVMQGLDFQILSAKDLNLNMHTEENGRDYEETALEKAQFYFNQTGEITLAEDSGIEVDALKGELGLKTRRWGAGENASDEEWIEYFLNKMKDVPDLERGAKFVCVAAIVGKDFQQIFRGETRGVVTHALLAPIKKGIPLSSCFIPDGFNKVYSALSEAEKNSVSHRGKAMHMVKDFIAKLA